jgi:hypothetical protein
MRRCGSSSHCWRQRMRARTTALSRRTESSKLTRRPTFPMAVARSYCCVAQTRASPASCSRRTAAGSRSSGRRTRDFSRLSTTLDAHIGDVSIFGVAAAGAAASPSVTLFYRTPNPLTYDVRWDVTGWHAEKPEVILKQEFRDQNAGTHATHTVVAKIGRKSLSFEFPK